MPNLGAVAMLSDLDNATGVHPYAAADVLTGAVKKRGRVLYASDFRGSFDGFKPVHNKGGSESARPPLSLAEDPAHSLRLAAPGSRMGQGNSADAILRLERPEEGAAVSVSFHYTLFTEYAFNSPTTAEHAPPFYQISFGLDTQAADNTDRQFFEAIFRPVPSQGSWRLYLRTHKEGDVHNGTIKIFDTQLFGFLLGQNENKANDGYLRLTMVPGKQARYVELQCGGRVVSLDFPGMERVREPLQYSTTDWQAAFGGGCNPFEGVQTVASDNNVTAAGINSHKFLVTVGDELA